MIIVDQNLPALANVSDSILWSLSTVKDNK